MKKVLILALSCFSITLFANSSQLADNGAYINLNAGFASSQFLPSGLLATTANAGYNFNSNFGLEGGYTFLAGSQFGSTVNNNIFDVAVKGTVPLSSIFSLYGRLGAGVDFMQWGGTANAGAPNWYCAQNNSSNFIGLAGVGGSFALSKHFALRLEDTLYIPTGGGNATSGQTNLVLGGVQFNF